MTGKKAKQFDKNPVEARRENPFQNLEEAKNIPQALKEEVKLDIRTAWEQMFGLGVYKTSGEMVEGQEIDLVLRKERKVAKPEKRVEAGIDYISEVLHGEKRISRHEQLALNQRIDQLIEELRKLAKSSKTLEVQFKEVVVEQRPVAAGKYHINFFEWMLSMIRAARIKVEESGSWLATIAGKGKKKDYWGLAKKHGTQFSLSGERVVATQVG